MSRANSILILVAMIVTAVSVAILLNVQFAFPLGQAAALGLGVLFGLVLFQQFTERRKDREWLEARVDEIAAVAGDSHTELGKLATRLTRLEQTLALRIREENEPLAAEVEVVGQLLKQIAEGLAELEAKVDRRLGDLDMRTEAISSRQAALASAPTLRGDTPRPARRDSARPAVDEAPGMAMQATSLFVSEPTPLPTAFDREVEKLIRTESIEIHLQPIVTLPQRKVRYYEVLTRLKGDKGLITAEEFLSAAEQQRVISKLDTYQVIRSFQILKRLTQRNSEVGLFVNLSTESLASSGFFREFQSFLAQNRTVADLVHFEFKQSAIRAMGPLESESLKAVSEMGYRFSIDNVTDLRMDFGDLADLGFRVAKVRAERLLGRQPLVQGDIHPEDMAGHLQRQGLTLIVDHIEQESQVIDLLDYGIPFGQGFLFSPPRQVRPEVVGAAAAAAPVSPAAGSAGGRGPGGVQR